MAAIDVVDCYVAALPGASGRRLARGEWGLTVAAQQAAGWPLDVGLRLSQGLLTARAHALDSPTGLDPWMLLWWNRQTRLARFGATEDRAVWVHADLIAAGVDEQAVDRLLGLVVEGAVNVREAQRRGRGARAPGGETG